MRSKYVVKNSFWTTINSIVNILIGFISRSVFIYFLNLFIFFAPLRCSQVYKKPLSLYLYLSIKIANILLAKILLIFFQKRLKFC